MTTAGIYNLCIAKGSTFEVTFRLKDKATDAPIDLTGLDVRSKIRTSYGASATLIDPVTTITDATNGAIKLALASDADIPDNIAPLQFAQISNWATKLQLTDIERKLFNAGTPAYVWDLETFDSSDPPVVTRRLNGMVAVTTEVTS